MKGVILAAGYGTRFLPGTKTIPKEMFPLIDRPAIDFIVEEFILSGIEEILIITSRRKKVLEDYFDREIELESVLSPEKRELMDRIRPAAARFTFIRQQEMRGTGDALLLCENFAGGEPLIVAYPDDLVFSDIPLTRQLAEARRKPEDAVLAVMEIPAEEAHRYGIVETDGSGGVMGITEKPAPGSARSNLALIGRYIITPDIFPLLREEREKCESGEYYQIDPLNRLAERGDVTSCTFRGMRLDIGQPDGYLQAIMEYAAIRPELAPVLDRTAKDILARE